MCSEHGWMCKLDSIRVEVPLHTMLAAVNALIKQSARFLRFFYCQILLWCATLSCTHTREFYAWGENRQNSSSKIKPISSYVVCVVKTLWFRFSSMWHFFFPRFYASYKCDRPNKRQPWVRIHCDFLRKSTEIISQIEMRISISKNPIPRFHGI